MPYQVLARKYRPLRFSDVVGQDHVTRTLLNAIAQNRIAHGYIFSGHRGIGKTTIARILASALNCRNAIGSPLRPTPEPCNQCDSCLEIRAGNAVDVIEIDAATNRGIDEVRELRDAARYRPSRDKYKIIILDEAHQITDAAFNALLKTLEEPPDHIVFMFATTQPEDIPQTIRSRCQHFSFHAVKLDDIVGQLRKIATDEKIDVDDTALALLAEAGDGSMRDALSIMDQAIASAPLAPAGDSEGQPVVTADQIRELMGTVSNVVYEQILEAVHANSSSDVLTTINKLLDAGNGPQQLARQFVRYLRNCTVAKITQLSPAPDAPEATGVARDLLQISEAERKRAARSAALFTEEELSRFLAIMLRTFDELGYRQEPRFHLELDLLKLVHAQRLLPVEDLLSQLAGKAPAPQPSAATAAASTLSASRSTGSVVSSTPPPRPSPLEADRSRKTPTASVSASEPATMKTDGSLALAADPLVSAKTEPTPVVERPHLVTTSIQTSATTESDVQSATEPGGPSFAVSPQRVGSEGNGATTVSTPTASTSPASSPDLQSLQTACVAALEAAKGQSSSAHTIDEATFALAGDTLEIKIGVSRAMLPTLINAEAERILNATVRQHQAGLKLKLLPGAPVNKAEKKASRPATSGSAAELAAKHPLVQQAQQLFGAEISNVIDLRDKT